MGPQDIRNGPPSELLKKDSQESPSGQETIKLGPKQQSSQLQQSKNIRICISPMYEGDKKDLISKNLCGRVTNPDLVSVTGGHERLNSIEDSETSDN